MRIQLISPALRSHKGNWVTAERWSRILRRLGHRISISQEYAGESCDLLVALHARKSFASIERFQLEHPRRPLFLTLTGTDLYRDIRFDEDSRQAMRWADRLILLQPLGRDELVPALRDKTRVIRQSAVRTRSRVPKSRRWLDVCVVGHLRPVKDPFRTAAAARLLPGTSRVRVVHAGGALSQEMEKRARVEMAENPRYKWLGDRSRWQVRRLMERSHVMVLSSKLEGGANVVSEALVARLPVISTRISGSIGMLGEDHPGYFEVGDTEALAALMSRCETDSGFLRELERRSRELAPLYDPAREEEVWKDLLAELSRPSPAGAIESSPGFQPGVAWDLNRPRRF
ncbi:MAG: TIGR04348 family glycosyltransferase [bacterium]|nr:TIGR04348 family glycosyltransferase [bacterium]